jgi:hypothetical protein
MTSASSTRTAIGSSGAPTKPIRVSDREYFKFHVENPDDQLLHISKPELGRITGKWAIHVTRRINRADGSFAGIAIVSLDPAYFIRFYEQADLGRQGVVTLVGLDGIARARYAGNRGTFGDDLRTSPLMREQKQHAVGTFFGPGFVDGIPRFCSYRTLQEYPLVVLVGTSQQEALASFYKYERAYYFLVFALVTVLVAFFATAWIGALSRHRLTRTCPTIRPPSALPASRSTGASSRSIPLSAACWATRRRSCSHVR